MNWRIKSEGKDTRTIQYSVKSGEQLEGARENIGLELT